MDTMPDFPLPDGFLFPDRRTREEALHRFGWTLPSRSSLAAVLAACPGREIIDAGSGNGLWSRFLEDIGFSVVAVDNGAWRYPGIFRKADLTSLSEALSLYPGVPVLASYPDTSVADELVAMARADTTVVHMGGFPETGSQAYRLALLGRAGKWFAALGPTGPKPGLVAVMPGHDLFWS